MARWKASRVMIVPALSCHHLPGQTWHAALPLVPLDLLPSQGARRMSFQAFVGSLPRLAEARGCERGEVVRRLLACEGPTLR